MIQSKFAIFWDAAPLGFGPQGLPFPTNRFEEIKYWKTREEAEKYLEIIRVRKIDYLDIDNFKIKEVEILFRIV